MKVRLSMLSCLLAVSAFAADVTGKWNAEMPGRDGQTRQVPFNFKADGATLTGTVGGMGGDTEIKNGKVVGDEISFDVIREFNGNEFKMHYVGKVSGNEIKFKIERPAGGPGGAQGKGGGKRGPSEFTAKRVTS
ncbi:MAG: hypothetical protein HY820_00820 [Acidobacteria bacterium]|nr:hypothetical protein [Acidobacteriota bacterium]